MIKAFKINGGWKSRDIQDPVGGEPCARSHAQGRSGSHVLRHRWTTSLKSSKRPCRVSHCPFGLWMYIYQLIDLRDPKPSGKVGLEVTVCLCHHLLHRLNVVCVGLRRVARSSSQAQ